MEHAVVQKEGPTHTNERWDKDDSKGDIGVGTKILRKIKYGNQALQVTIHHDNLGRIHRHG
jgi:hypothetical protein